MADLGNVLPLTSKRITYASNIGNFILALSTCFVIISGFILSNEQFLHWFVIPVVMCGALIGTDAINWVRGRVDILDPSGILGLLGFHYFFLAPLLHVLWNYWMSYIVPPNDWRPWLGQMALINFCGLLIYRIVRTWRIGTLKKNSIRAKWELSTKHFNLVLCIFLIVSAGLQFWVYYEQGGILGYIATFSENSQANLAAFKGMGWVFTISESFPILAMLGFTVFSAKRHFSKTWLILILSLVIFLVLQLLFGGLRGSRSNTIWALFWAVGIIHIWIRPIPRKLIFIGIIFLIVFMYFYGFYKSVGLGVLSVLDRPDSLVELEQQSRRSSETLILGDLARSDVQAFLLYRLNEIGNDYQYAWGRTYLAGFALLIPQSIWPDRPPTKVKEGTEIQYGSGTYIPEGHRKFVSSRVYGLSGEIMLNFGPIAVPFGFAILGFIVANIQHWLAHWDKDDTRRLLLPFMVILSFTILTSDSDNIMFYIIKNGTLPILLIVLNSRIQKYNINATSNNA